MIAASCTLNGTSGHDAGRQLLEKLYRLQTGLPLPAIAVTPRGKPYFPDSGYHFSISHTDRHAFCVLAQCEVGIDAEEADRVIRPELIARILSPAEQKRVCASSDVLRLWVLKEAAVKLSGEGLRGFPNQTDFDPQDARIQEWAGCLVALMAENPDEGVTYYAF